MNENKIVFKLNKHKKLWEVMPDYILKIVRESNGEGNMGGFVSLAKHRALVDLFPNFFPDSPISYILTVICFPTAFFPVSQFGIKFIN